MKRSGSESPVSNHDPDDHNPLLDEHFEKAEAECGRCVAKGGSPADSMSSWQPGGSPFPFTTSALLRKTDQCAHTLLQRHMDETDGRLMMEAVTALEAIGTPAAVRERLASGPESTAKVYDAAAREVIALSSSSSGLATCPPLAPADAPLSSLEEVTESVKRACRVIDTLVGRVPSRVVYKVPRSLQTRLLPLLYAWAVDWEILNRFMSLWTSVVATLCAVIRAPRWAATPPVVLPWKPLLCLVAALMDPSNTTRANLTRFISIQHVVASELEELCRQCSTCFDPSALEGLWEFCAPHFSHRGMEVSSAYLYIFFLLCPVHTLSPPSPVNGSAAPALPTPIALLLQYIFTECCNKNTTRLWLSIAFHFIGVLARFNPGMMDLDAYAEPFFTLALRALELGNDSEHRVPGDQSKFFLLRSLLSYQTTPQKVATSVSRVVYALPAKTTSPLWNQLRRFLHATRVFLRPDAKDWGQAKTVASLYSCMVEAARRRIEHQQCFISASGEAGTTGAPSIPTGYVWTDDTVKAFVDLVQDGVLVTLNCGRLKHSVELVAELTRLAPAHMRAFVFLKATAAFNHKTQDLGRQVLALKLLQCSAYPLLCASSESCDALLAYTREHIIPRTSTWMDCSDANVSEKMLLYFWTLSTCVKFNRLFANDEAAETRFATALAEHLISMSYREMSKSWFASLRSITAAFSASAFEVFSSKILQACKGRGAELPSLLTPIGQRDPVRVMAFTKTQVLPLLTEHNSNDKDVTWASTTLEKCVECLSRDEIYQLRTDLEKCLQMLLANLTSSSRRDEAVRLYRVFYSAMLYPRCTLPDGEDGSMAFRPHRPLKKEMSSTSCLPQLRELGFCTTEEVDLRWETPKESHVVYMKDLLDRIMTDIFFVAENAEDIEVNEEKPPKNLRDLVVPSSGKKRKAKTAAEAQARKAKATESEQVGSLVSDSSRGYAVPDVIDGLASVLSSILSINGAIYHRPAVFTGQAGDGAEVVKVQAGSKRYTLPAFNWGYQKRCCSLTPYLIEAAGASKITPRFSLDEIFDKVVMLFLPRISKESVNFADQTFGRLLGEFLGANYKNSIGGKGQKITLEEDQTYESPRALTSTLTLLTKLCVFVSSANAPDDHVAQKINTEKELYLSCYAGTRPYNASYFPQAFWQLNAMHVFSSLEFNFVFSTSLSRRQILSDLLFRFLFFAAPTVAKCCHLGLSTVVSQTASPLRRRIFSKVADLMEGMAVKWLTVTRKEGVELFRRLLAEDDDGVSGYSPDDIEKAKRLLGGEEESMALGDGVELEDDEDEKRETKKGKAVLKGNGIAETPKYANQVMSSFIVLLCHWFTSSCAFAFDRTLIRVAKILLSFPVDLSSPHALLAIHRSMRRPLTGVHDPREVLNCVEQLVHMAYRYAYIQPARAIFVLFLGGYSLQPWIGMPVQKSTVEQLLRMCTNPVLGVQRQARFLLNAMLVSTPTTKLSVSVIPMRTKNSALTFIPSDEEVRVFQERYNHIHHQYGFSFIDNSCRFPSKVARIVSFGPAAEHEQLMRRVCPPSCAGSELTTEETALYVGYRFVWPSEAGSSSTSNTESSGSNNVRRAVEGMLSMTSSAASELRKSWFWSYIHTTRMPNATVEQTQVVIWSAIVKLLSEKQTMVLLKVAQLSLQEVQESMKVSSFAPDGSEGSNSTVLEVVEHYLVCVNAIVGMLRGVKENGSPALRKEVLLVFLEAINLAFMNNSHQRMSDALMRALYQVRETVKLEEAWALFENLFAVLERSEKKAVDGGDERQSRWVSNVLRCLSFLVVVFTVEFTGKLLDRILGRLQSISKTLWYGRTQLWRTTASGLVGAVLRFANYESLLIPGYDNVEKKLIRYAADTMEKEISFPTASVAGEDGSAQSNVNRLSMLKTFALSWGSPSPSLIVALHAPLTNLLLRCFDISLPEIDDLENVVSFAITNIAQTPMPKLVVHELIESWCGVLEKGTITSSSSSAVVPLPRHARSGLTHALGILIFKNLHRIGKFTMMETVGEAALSSLASSDGRVRPEGQLLFSVLSRVASVDQMSSLLSMYEEALKKTTVSPTPPATEAEKVERARRTALVLACCAAVLADSCGVPVYVPRLMRRLVPYANDGVLDVQRMTRQMFSQWWRTHRDTWEAEVKEKFTPAQIEALMPLMTAGSFG